MFHDGGGDRSRTVTAVRELIPRLRARGFRFVTVSELAGLPRSVVEPAASPWERRRGEAFAWAVRLAFQRIIGGPDYQARLWHHARKMGLLHRVGKLMGKQPLPLCFMRPVFPSPEHDVSANGVGVRVDCTC